MVVDEIPQEIVMKLFLTATVHHNITINTNNNGSLCSETCIKQVVENLGLDQFINNTQQIQLNRLVANKSTHHSLFSINFSTHNQGNTSLTVRKKRHVTTSSVNMTKSGQDLVVYNKTFGEGNPPPEFRLEDVRSQCKYPEYVVFTWVLCLIALATALKLYYLVKTFLAVIMLAIYTVLILIPCQDIFGRFEAENGDE